MSRTQCCPMSSGHSVYDEEPESCRQELVEQSGTLGKPSGGSGTANHVPPPKSIDKIKEMPLHARHAQDPHNSIQLLQNRTSKLSCG